MEDSCGNGSMEVSSHCNGVKIEDEIVANFDSYFEDVDDCLTISRMVNDSVIKGMVNAVTEEAAEKIALKEQEVASLKKRLEFYESGGTYKLDESKSADVVGQDTVEECVRNLKFVSEKQFRMLEEKIEDVKRCDAFPGQSERTESGKWVGVAQTLHTLRNVVNTFCMRVENLVCLSKPSLCEWRDQRKFEDDIEVMVIRNSIRGFLEDFEINSWKQGPQLSGSQYTNQLAKINQLSSLRQELDIISRTLSSPEMGQFPLNGSDESGEQCTNGKRKDHFLRKAFSSDISQFIKEANGKNQESKTDLSETMESASLKHMTKDEIVSFFKSEITRMKRNHESQVQEITEEYFRLRREFLKESGPLSSLRKDKEFEAFRKKIPELMVKLDDVLFKNEKLSVLYGNNEIICNLKNRIDTLLSENQQIKGLLTSKSKEVKHLSSQLSSAADKISQHFVTEANLLKRIRKLKCDMQDMSFETSVREDVDKCILKELMGKIKWSVEESNMKFVATLEFYEIYFKEFAKDARAICRWNIEDSNMESVIMQEICGTIFREAAQDAERRLNLMKMKYEGQNERLVSLEASVLESEKALNSVIEEKDQLNHKLVKISALLEEKEKVALETGSKLMKEKERTDLLYQDLSLFKDQAIQQEKLVSVTERESNMIKSKLEEALGQTHLYEDKIAKLDKKLKLAIEDLEEANKEMKRLQVIIQQKENALSLVVARESGQKKQVESLSTYVERLFKTAADFEGQTMEIVEKNNLRLKRLKFQLYPLVQNPALSRKSELVYKERLERRYSDLQKAEAEVDLLGDEVDALLSLLEKIYIGLNHYSPILQHYPGIMEILKLIKRELSVESFKSISSC